MNQRAKSRSPTERPSTLTLVPRFLLGGAYLAGVVGVVTIGTRHSFLESLAMTAASAMAGFAIALMLAVQWSLREEGSRWQMRLSSVFLIITMMAIYLGFVRWVFGGIHGQVHGSDFPYWPVIPIGVFTLLGIPCVIFVGESLLWLAVWLVRRRTFRWLLRRWLSLHHRG